MNCNTCQPFHRFTPSSPTCQCCIQGSQHSDHRFYEERKIQDLKRTRYQYKERITVLQWIVVALISCSLLGVFVVLYLLHMGIIE